MDTAEDEEAKESPTTPGGTALGEYKISRELGRGAMGAVYRARQPRLKRDVALKVILSSRFAGEAARKRFLAEAELAAQLDHPNIVPIYEVGETQDGPFYVMKLVEGGTLADRIPDFLNDSSSVAALMVKIALAVHHAHQRGVLHRDLKPGNILIDAAGQPHVADFGLARQLGTEGSLTISGMMLGTPAYMSPEQAAGERGITTAADVWSLGAILYHLLTGRPPFTGENATDILLKVRTEDAPSVRTLNPKVPRDLETICVKCLEKEPLRRYVSAGDLAAELQRFLAHEPIHARPVTLAERVSKWARRHPARAAAIAAFLIVLTGAVVGIASQWQRAETHAGESTQRLVRMTTMAGLRRLEDRDFLTALPWFAEALRLDPKAALAHRVRFATAMRHAPRLQQLWFPEGSLEHIGFSPDGIRVLTIIKGEARLWNVLNGETSPPLAHGQPVDAWDFSPDGKRLATASRDGIVKLWNARTGQALAPEFAHVKGQRVKLRFSPDGSLLLTRTGPSARLWDGHTGHSQPVEFQQSSALIDARFSADGKRLWTATAATAQIWVIATGEAVGSRWRHDLGEFQPSPDFSRAIVFRNGGVEIRSGTNGTLLMAPLRHDGSVRDAKFSPDGKRVATIAVDGTARVWDSITGLPVTPLLRHSENSQDVNFSPDGRWIVTGNEDHTAQVWDATRGMPLFSPLWHGHVVKRAIFSPDARRILAVSSDGAVRIWDLSSGTAGVIALEGHGKLKAGVFDEHGRLVTVSENEAVQAWDALSGKLLGVVFEHKPPCHCAALSPDGSKLATGAEDGRVRIWEVASGALITKLQQTGDVGSVEWRRDGEAILASSAGAVHYAQVWNLKNQSVLTAPMGHGSQIKQAIFSADGTRVATATTSGSARVWDAQTGRPLIEKLKHTAAVNRIRFSPDGKQLATASADNTARLWNSLTGEPATAALHHGGPVTDLAFSPDGGSLLTASQDGTARIWITATGKPRTSPMWMRGSVGRPSFSRDGRMLLFGNGYYAQVWDPESGMPLTPPLNNVQASGFQAVFSPDQQRILAITVDRRLVSVDITGLDWPIEDLAAAARLLSSREMDATGAAVPLSQAVEGGAAGARAVLERDWKRLRPRLSSNSETVDTAASLEWHREQAVAAELSKDWYAAAFHLARLCVAQPEEATLRQRYVAACARLETVGPVPAAAKHFPERAIGLSARLIDLTPYFNFRLTDSLHSNKLDNSLSALPPGVTNLGGVDFDIRGLVHLASRRPGDDNLPKAIRGIHVGLTTRKLHFLHACSHDADKAEIATFVVHFANRMQAEIPILYGRDLLDWHGKPGNSPANEAVVWTGTNADSLQSKTQIRLFKTTWINPVANGEIESLDYISKLTASAPFLIAITAEE